MNDGNLIVIAAAVAALLIVSQAWKIKIRLWALGFGLWALGACQMYPKMFDSPEFQRASIEMMKQGNKTWIADGKVKNPRFGVYHIIGFEAAVTGIEGELGIRGATGPQSTTQPVDK